jgi:hypothetical protein
VQSLIILLASVVLALAGMMLVRRSAKPSLLEPHNDVAGAAYQTLGTVYAILLAFVCVLAWQRFDTAGTEAYHEANTVTSLHEMAQSFSAPGRAQIDGGLLRYTQLVVDDEWERMASGEQSLATDRSLGDLWQRYRELPTADRQEPEYAQSLSQMTVLEDTRGVRLQTASGQIPRVLWVVLVAGAVVAIAFSYLFGVKNLWAQTLITVALTLAIAGVLVLTYVLDDPYRGAVRVRPDAIRTAQMALTR